MGVICLCDLILILLYLGICCCLIVCLFDVYLLEMVMLMVMVEWYSLFLGKGWLWWVLCCDGVFDL